MRSLAPRDSQSRGLTPPQVKGRRPFPPEARCVLEGGWRTHPRRSPGAPLSQLPAHISTVCVCVCVLLCDLSLQFVSTSGFQGLSTPAPSMLHSAGSL